MEDSDTTREVRERYGLPDSFVLAVGARRPHKNFRMLVRAVSRLENAELVFVGNADKRFTDDAANETARAGSRVRFLGAVPEADLPILYNLATVVACPSLIEGFGLPLLEAMSCGTPVVCSDIPVFREVAGDAVIYVDPRNEAAWARALNDVLGKAELRAKLRESGLQRASQFTWERAARALVPLHARLSPQTT
jgi:glycosyltransferase involved in cell wall biosynthesis